MYTQVPQYFLYIILLVVILCATFFALKQKTTVENIQLITVKASDKSIIVRARGTNAQEKIGLFINGQPQTFWTLSRSWDEYAFSPENKISVNSLTIEFLNDTWEPEKNINYDVQIDYVKIGDEVYQSEDATTYSTGTWDQDNWCAPGTKQNEWLHCSGKLSYDIATNTTVGPSDISEPSLIDPCADKCLAHSEEVNYTRISLPEYLTPFKDPTFNTQITRITDAPSGTVRKTLYSTIQAWNADESLMILYHNDDGHHLYDGQTYKYLRKLEDITPADLEEIFWDPKNANEFYYIDSYNGNQGTYGSLIRYNVATQAKEVIKDFSTLCQSKIVGGSDVHMMSWDGNIIGAQCLSVDSKHIAFAYNIKDNRIIGPIANNHDFRTAPMPGPSGLYYYFRGRSLDNSLSPLQTLVSKQGEHSSIGQVDNGDGTFSDTYVAVSFGGDSCGAGNLIIHNLETGKCKSIIGEDSGYQYTQSGTHISALSYKNPGWIAISSIGYADDVTDNAKPPFSGEVYLAYPRFNGDDTVYRLAHHHSYGEFGSTGYFAEPHPVISPTGSRILFSSDWGNTGTVDTYVIDLRVN